MEAVLIQQLKVLKSAFEESASLPTYRPGPRSLLREFNELRGVAIQAAPDPSWQALIETIPTLKEGDGTLTEAESREGINKSERLIALLESLRDEQKKQDSVPPPVYQKELPRLVPETKRIFIIHGHDKVNTLLLKELLRDRFKVDPVILNEKAEEGRTLIEKFEQIADGASYAFALMTPDDMVQTKTGVEPQARPNVIFELGWFYGRLGRKRVCILFRKGTSIHSDLNGIVKLEFIDSITEKVLEIERELSAAAVI